MSLNIQKIALRVGFVCFLIHLPVIQLLCAIVLEMPSNRIFILPMYQYLAQNIEVFV